MNASAQPREFKLSSGKGVGVWCDESRAFVNDVPLLERTITDWSPRNDDDLSKALSRAYGLPVDVSAKRGGLAAVAKAVNDGDIARAQIATLLLQFPNPLALSKRAASQTEIIELASQLHWSGLLKFDPNHYPAGSPNNEGGEFAPDVSGAPQWTRERLADIARRSEGSKDYLRYRAHGGVAAGPDKCNIAVADWIEQARLLPPGVPYSDWKRDLPFTKPPSAHEWADPNIVIRGWSAPMPVRNAQPGDVIAEAHNGSHGHVGIVVGPDRTASVSDRTDPEGIVVVNEWGFRPAGLPPYGNGEDGPDQYVVVRRYTGYR